MALQRIITDTVEQTIEKFDKIKTSLETMETLKILGQIGVRFQFLQHQNSSTRLCNDTQKQNER